MISAPAERGVQPVPRKIQQESRNSGDRELGDGLLTEPQSCRDTDTILTIQLLLISRRFLRFVVRRIPV